MIIEETDVKNARIMAIVLLAVAVIVYFVFSFKLFSYSEERPNIFRKKYEACTSAGKVLADSMLATGNVEHSIGNTLNPPKKGKYDIFSDVAGKHQ